jgi:hypothetical protein
MAAALTRACTSGLTKAVPLRILDTVEGLTPAVRAMSRALILLVTQRLVENLSSKLYPGQEKFHFFRKYFRRNNPSQKGPIGI